MNRTTTPILLVVLLSYGAVFALLGFWRISSQKPRQAPQPAPALSAAQSALPAGPAPILDTPAPFQRRLPVSGWRGTL